MFPHSAARIPNAILTSSFLPLRVMLFFFIPYWTLPIMEIHQAYLYIHLFFNYCSNLQLSCLHWSRKAYLLRSKCIWHSDEGLLCSKSSPSNSIRPEELERGLSRN